MKRSFCSLLILLSLPLLLLGAISSAQDQPEILPSPYYFPEDIAYFPKSPEFKLAREAAAMKAYRDEQEASLVSKEDSASGNKLVADSLAMLGKQRTVSAKLRIKTMAYGHELVGTGEYQQMGLGASPMLRLEMKIPIANKMTSKLQVSNGKIMWTRTEIEEGEPQVSRVDLERIREQVEKQKVTPHIDPAINWMMFGGLSRLLAGLSSNFEFGEARADVLQEEPVWIVTGVWKPEALAKVATHLKNDVLAKKPDVLAKLPPHLPVAVTLVLDRGEKGANFPYRIEYLHLADGKATLGPDSTTPYLVMELYEVDFEADLNAKMFDFRPTDAESVVEQTELYLKDLLPEKPATAQETSRRVK